MQGTITRLERQQRRRKRVSVFLDEEYAFSLEELTAAALHPGQRLEEGDIEELLRRDAVNRAQERALALLEGRPRSRLELAQRLRRAGFEPPVVEEALGRLERVDLVNDGAFADFWVDQRLTFRPRSRRALSYELRRQGVPDEAIDRALNQVDDSATAQTLIRRQLERMEPRQTQEAVRQKLCALLRNRGFGYHTIKDALDSLEPSEPCRLSESEPDGLDHSREDE